MKIKAVLISAVVVLTAMGSSVRPCPAWGDEGDVALRLTRSGLHRGTLYRREPAGCWTLSGAAAPQNVVAIRVDFPPDTTSNTTGTGQFDLSTSSDEDINPPPHDRTYFERQMESLRRYYVKVSRGAVDFSYIVYPEPHDGAYTLPHEMAFYAPNLTDEENDIRLAEFFRDAIGAADAAGDFQFSQFDAVIIFHAGVGADIAFSFDETPNDIPSAFMDTEWLVWALGSQYAQGVPVEGGGHHVPEGLWMPETLNQQDVEFGLTGLLAKLFGHQLGLPNLYSSEDGSSGIGIWGLMDQGSGNEQGLIPAVPCAWSRVFLGWEQPLVVRQGLDVAIDALMTDGLNPPIIKVPINADEYFLLENRQRDVFDDGAVATSDGGVIIEVDEYDWGIPGSGLLIWHIDEGVIRENYESNTVNADPLHRGVDLEEADGFQDIGFIIYGGYVTYGLPEDAFYQGNNTEFTPGSNPNSNSNSGADSHISITGISSSGPTMSCDVAMDLLQPGWPDSVGISLSENPPLVGDLDGDGDVEIVVNTPDGKVFAWNHDGTALLSGGDGLALFVDLKNPIVGPLALGDLDGGGLEILLAEESGYLHAWNHLGQEPEGFPYEFDHTLSSPVVVAPPGVGDVAYSFKLADLLVATADGWVYGIGLFSLRDMMLEDSGLLWEIDLGDEVITSLAIAEDPDISSSYLMVAGAADGQVSWWYPYRIGATVRRAETFSEIVGLATADLDRDEQVEVIAANAEGEIYAWNLDGTLASGWPMETGNPVESSPALGDLDGDGYLEVVISGTSEIWAWNYNGTPVMNFPITISRTDPVGTLRSSPVLGDVDGDGSVDIVVGTPQGLLMAYNRLGMLLDGWPLACAGEINASPTLADIDGDGDIEVLAGDAAGWMYVWDLPAQPDTEGLPWPNWGHDVRHTSAYPREALPPSPQPGELLPEASVYNYPNPTQGQTTTIRYTLGQEAEVHIRIYDVSGDLVDEFPGSGYAHTENEVEWDLHDIASGVYLCRVEARVSWGTQTEFCKIAVVK